MARAILAEFASPEALAAAIRRLRGDAHARLEAYVPYPAPEVEEALDRPRSRLPLVVFAAGATAAVLAYGLQWLLVAHLYPIDVGGRPPHFPLAFVIITFEMTILFASLTAVAGVLVLGRLVRLTDEVQGTDGFESATGDRFWLEVSPRDAGLDEPATRATLAELGALRVVGAGETGGAP